MCTACKSLDSAAVANCFSCAKLLCANCVIAHQLMIAFEGHTVASLGQQLQVEEGGLVGGVEGLVEGDEEEAGRAAQDR